MLLAQRSVRSEFGLTWSTIGGTTNEGEDSLTTVIRVAKEKLAIDIDHHIKATGSAVNDHGGWSYATICITPKEPINFHDMILDPERFIGIGWFSRTELRKLELHPRDRKSVV